MRLFEYKDYRKFVRDRIKTLPSGGRGELTRLARALGVHTTMISHIMKGQCELSLEQALRLADHFALNDLETDYLVALVQMERAGDKRAKDYCRAKVNDLQRRALDLSARLNTQNRLNEEDRAVFYSSPLYAHVRLLTAIERLQTFEALQEAVKVPPKRLRAVLDFLVSRGLCLESKGRYVYAPMPTYVEASSPLVARHHMNWRQRAQERIENLRPEDLMYTYPTVISEEAFQLIREKLIRFLEDFKSVTGPAPSEDLYCLNIDWIKI